MTRHLLSVVLLLLVSVLFFCLVLFTGLTTLLSAEPFGNSPLNTPRAAGVVVGGISVAVQMLCMVMVGRSASPLVFRMIIVAVGVGICVYHGFVLIAVIERWQRWGSAPKFWSGDTGSFWWSLAVSALAPPVFYVVARFTRRTVSPQ